MGVLFIVSGSAITTLLLFIPYPHGKANEPHVCVVHPANGDMSQTHSIDNSIFGVVEMRVPLMNMMLIKTTTKIMTTRIAPWENQLMYLGSTILTTF